MTANTEYKKTRRSLFAFRFSPEVRAPRQGENAARWLCEKRTAQNIFSNIRLVFVAPFPATGLEGLHHGMARFLEVLVGVLTGRGVAAADVSANQALA
jgi:hypothetical protein